MALHAPTSKMWKQQDDVFENTYIDPSVRYGNSEVVSAMS
jgi:hypothetical protein